MRSGRLVVTTAAALVVGLLPLVAAHNHDTTHEDMDKAAGESGKASAQEATSYFRYPHYAGWMYAHIALMIVSWAIVLPPTIMLTLVRSKSHLPLQVVFHVLNGVGIFTSFVYNQSTPDLYKNNCHGPIGWVCTSCVIAWTVMSLFVAYGEHKSKRRSAMPAPYNRMEQYRDSASIRRSRDSGQGTERNSVSLLGSRQSSQDAVYQKPAAPPSPTSPTYDEEHAEDDDGHSEKRGLLGNNRVDRFISRNVLRFSTQRALKAIRFCQTVIQSVLLILAFMAVATGFPVWGGIFRGRYVFSGLAHFIKGGIFFWYGILTLGRWMGAFSEPGWAWNVRPVYPIVPRWITRLPSAEWLESFCIFFYGATQMFMERLNGAGRGWSNKDFEHVSITLLFFGGGLLGMMIESSWARESMNTAVEVQKSKEDEVGGVSRFYASDAVEEPDKLWVQPKTHKASLNPAPALVIMLLGMMMSAHKQDSMTSTMMHAQWGGLFTAFALARGATYIILWLKPPTSHFPSRPPSEIVASFCLLSGGLMFMFSASDVVDSIESNHFDAMAIFTTTMGLSALILAWEMIVYSIKGWAVKKERLAAARPVV